MISPLTASLDAGSFDITALDELHFTDAAAAASAAGRLRRNAANLTWHNGTAARNLVFTISGITLTNGAIPVGGGASPEWATITAGTGIAVTNGVGTITIGLTDSGTVGLVPPAVSGTPAQHALFRENVVKGWVNCNYAGTITDSFNVSSITDNAVGRTTITWDRDFANTGYAVVATVRSVVAMIVTVAVQAVGSIEADTFNSTFALADAVELQVVAIGDQ